MLGSLDGPLLPLTVLFEPTAMSGIRSSCVICSRGAPRCCRGAPGGAGTAGSTSSYPRRARIRSSSGRKETWCVCSPPKSEGKRLSSSRSPRRSGFNEPSGRPLTAMRSVGRNVPRKEGLDKVTGRALYVDDRTFPGMLHGRTIRSTIAAGEIEGIHLGFGRKGFTIADCRDVPGRNVVALIELDQH